MSTDATPLQPHQQRVLAEADELRARMGKLSTFLMSDRVKPMNVMDQTLLHLQHSIMMAYVQVLDMRIARFGDTP